VGESSVEQMEFPALRLQQAVDALTETVFGQRLSLTGEHEHPLVTTARGYGASQ
jgi:hypothetical protein